MMYSSGIIGKAIALIVGIVALAFIVLFHSYSYEQWITWYTDADAHIYKKDDWTQDFFNPNTYATGLWFARVGIWAAFLAVWSIFKLTSDENKATENLKADTEKNHNTIIICLIGIAIWIYYILKVDAATDEIFSSYFFAEQPIWLAASYYPLPNNHILFNLLNHVGFKVLGDAITSGRLISGLCYLITLVSVDRFVSKWIADRWTRFSTMALIAVQLPVFGYATQARGYSLYILLGWLAFVYLYNYTKLQKSRDLLMYGLCCALGMWTIPSWLYIWVGLGGSYVALMIWHKKWDRQFALMTMISASVTYMLYLPVLCFSGWRPLLANKYVASTPFQSVSTFIQSIFDEHYFTGLFNDWIGLGSYTWVGMIFIFTIAFVFAKKKEDRTLFVFFLAIIVGICIVVLLMKKVPFYRNLAWHGLVFWVMIGIVLVRLFNKKMLVIVCSIGILLSIYINDTRFPFQLYYYDIAQLHASNRKVNLSSYSKIVIHEEAFYWLSYARSTSSNVSVSNIPDPESHFYIAKNDIDITLDSSIWKKYADGWYSTVYSRNFTKKK